MVKEIIKFFREFMSMWDKNPKKAIVGLMVIFFVVLAVFFCIDFLFFKSTPEIIPTTGTTNTPGNIIIGTVGGDVTQVLNVNNKVATYTWVNRDSFVVGYEDLYGSGTYRTDLKFEADSPALPNSVCPAIKFSSTKPISLVSAMPSGGSVSYGGCFKDPTAKMTIELITHGKPDKIEAQLRNE